SVSIPPAPDDGTCSLSLDNNTLTCTINVANSQTAATATATLTLTDAAGNQTVGGTDHTPTYAVDNAAPTISVGPSVLSVTGGADASTVMGGTTVQIQFTLADTGSGPDTTITPKVAFAGNAATSCTPATNTFTCS